MEVKTKNEKLDAFYKRIAIKYWIYGFLFGMALMYLINMAIEVGRLYGL